MSPASAGASCMQLQRPQSTALGREPDLSQLPVHEKDSLPAAGVALCDAADRCFAACSDPGACASDLGAQLPGLPPAAGDIIARLSEHPVMLNGTSCCVHGVL